VLFVGAVAARAPLLNHVGLALAVVLLGALALAFLGGWVFKGRSGWCGTFCPLGPIQRNYGQAPLVVVKNGWCEPCVGCQKNCYDFNPRAAVFSDVYDEDPRYAAQRRLFFGLLPGLILGYFLQGPAPAYGTAGQVAVLLASAAASAGLYQLLLVFVAGAEAQGRALTPYRLSMAFAGVALAAFYAFAGPVVVNTLAMLAGSVAPEALVAASRGTLRRAASASCGAPVASSKRARASPLSAAGALSSSARCSRWVARRTTAGSIGSPSARAITASTTRR
jgi:hypothetical protein